MRKQRRKQRQKRQQIRQEGWGGRYNARDVDRDVDGGKDRGIDGGSNGGIRDDIDGDDGAVALAEGGGSGVGRLPGGAAGRECHLAGGGPDPQEGRVLPLHMPHGGGVEGSDGDSQSPVHSTHHILRRPPWFPGRSRHRYRFP